MLFQQVTPGESHFCSITELTPQIAWYLAPFPLFGVFAAAAATGAATALGAAAVDAILAQTDAKTEAQAELEAGLMALNEAGVLSDSQTEIAFATLAVGAASALGAAAVNAII